MSFDPADFPLPRSLSPSRLNDYQTCPRKYEYAAVRKMPQPASYASVKGRFVHAILEHLFRLPPAERTIERAHSFVPAALAAEVTPEVRADLAFDDVMEARLLDESASILRTYFDMEDPTSVEVVPYQDSEGVEIKMFAPVDGTPLYGILDRLDRTADGDLVIVDYKTGAVPKGEYVAGAFANAALYAVLCERLLGELPARIRLLYIASGDVLERATRDVFPEQRKDAAVRIWGKIREDHQRGDFTPQPSPSNCRFCPESYKEECRRDGVDVPMPARRW